MCFSLFCNVFCTCLHYWYVKIYWAKRLQREQTHVHTIILHSHEHILLAMMKWNDFAQPRYLHPAIFFTTVNIWARESTITFKHAQQATTTAHTFISSFCFVIVSFFWTFESKFEQNWVVFDTLINNATRWSTVNKMTAERQNHIHRGLPQPSDVILMTCSEQMTTVKWQKSEKSEKKWKKVTFWAKLSRISEQFSAILSKIEQDLPDPSILFLVLRAILSNFEQNWAKLRRIYRGYQPILFLVLRKNLSKIEQDLPGPPILFNRSNFEQTC